MRDARPGIRELDRFARLAKLRVVITKVPCKLGWAENLSMSAVLRNVGALLADGKRLATGVPGMANSPPRQLITAKRPRS